MTHRDAHLFYVLQPGEDWAFFRGNLIVAHPDRPPKIIHPDGREEEISLAIPDETCYNRENKDKP